MRIGVNCYILAPDIGGIKQYFFSLFRELLDNDTDNEYVFFYFDHNVDELDSLGNSCWQKHGIALRNQNEIRKHLKKIDLYFCPFSTLWPRPLPVPTVVFLHDIQEVYYPEFFTRRNLAARAYHYVGSTRMADHVIVNSNFSKQTIIENHRVADKKISVAHLCADSRFYRANEVARSPEVMLPDEFVFFPANHWQHKNHDVLLRAIQWLKNEKQYRVHAVFTGYDQKNGYPVMDKAAQYGISEQVQQLGYVTVEELAYLYIYAKMLVFPSLFEGFGIPLVEAMAAGCPVLASEATSLPEIGQDNVLYFDPHSPKELGEKIIEMRSNVSLRRSLVKRGYVRARDFSASRMAASHLRAFEEAKNSFSESKYKPTQWIYEYFRLAKVAAKYRYFRL